ncbi:hypothetical protein [Pseudoflavonifractor sp. 60]|nr:hypothetical protein [Pseudoflavonifractor sp. 60]
MGASEIIGVLLLIAGICVLQFVGGSAGLIGGIVLVGAGIVLAGVFRRRK